MTTSTSNNKHHANATEKDFISASAKNKNEFGFNPLHRACHSNALRTVKKLLSEEGGKELVTAQDQHGWNPLHVACNTRGLFPLSSKGDIEILDILIRYGGEEALMQVNNAGMTPLRVVITKFFGYYTEEERRAWIERISFLVHKGIELKVGGEYTIGGLFNCPYVKKQVKDRIYSHCWDDRVLPVLEHVMTLRSNHRQCQPILQAIIMDEAPSHIIKDIVKHFPDCVNTPDSLGKYPIDVAAHHGLSWDGGMKEIVEVFVSASSKKNSALHVCAKHGVQWENGMKEVLERSNLGIAEREDISTGLYPFMLGAVGGDKISYDFDSVFHLIKKSPLLVRQYGGNMGQKQSSKRRNNNN